MFTAQNYGGLVHPDGCAPEAGASIIALRCLKRSEFEEVFPYFESGLRPSVLFPSRDDMRRLSGDIRGNAQIGIHPCGCECRVQTISRYVCPCLYKSAWTCTAVSSENKYYIIVVQRRCWEKKKTELQWFTEHWMVASKWQLPPPHTHTLEIAHCCFMSSHCERWDFYVLLLQKTQESCAGIVLCSVWCMKVFFFLSAFLQISQRLLLFCVIGILMQCCSNVNTYTAYHFIVSCTFPVWLTV